MIDVSEFRKVAKLSPCKVIKFAASDGSGFMSYNGKYYNNCDNCERIEIEQSYPDCRANHAEWGILKYNPSTLYIYCMTPDGKDYPFKRFWCKICAILIPMFGVDSVYMWNGEQWVFHNPKTLIDE